MIIYIWLKIVKITHFPWGATLSNNKLMALWIGGPNQHRHLCAVMNFDGAPAFINQGDKSLYRAGIWRYPLVNIQKTIENGHRNS